MDGPNVGGAVEGVVLAAFDAGRGREALWAGQFVLRSSRSPTTALSRLSMVSIFFSLYPQKIHVIVSQLL